MNDNRPPNPRFPLAGVVPTDGIPDGKYGNDGWLACDVNTGEIYVKSSGAWASLSDVLPATDPGYKVYRALLSQIDTDAPIATVLENTLGGIPAWTRNGTGNYFATLSGAFTVGKTLLFANQDAITGSASFA